MTNKELHVVFGASGGLGKAVVRKLVEEGKNVRGVNRSGMANVPGSVEMVAANILDINQALQAAKDATHIYNCVNASYQNWDKIYPEVTNVFIEVLRQTRAKGIITDNLYMYGEDIEEPLNENMEYHAQGKKGRMRIESAELYQQAMEKNEITALICRAPDFYGPGVTNSSFYGDRLFPGILAGKNVSLFGRADVPHAMIYVDDFAQAIYTLATSDKAYGEIWHAPIPPAITQQEFVDIAYQKAGTTGKLSTLPRTMIKVLRYVVPIIREVDEMLYEFERPYLVDDSKFRSEFGNGVTTHEQAIANTVVWYQEHFNV